jgi:hypothetical protein
MRLCVLGVPSHTLGAVVDMCRLAMGVTVSEVILNDDASTQSFLDAQDVHTNLIVSSFPRRNLLSWLIEHCVRTILVAPDIYVCMAHANKGSQEHRGLLPTALSYSLASLGMARQNLDCVLVTGRNFRAELKAVREELMRLQPTSRAPDLQKAEDQVITSLYHAVAVDHSAQDISAVSKSVLDETSSACRGLLDVLRDGKPPVLEWQVSLFADVSSRSRPAQDRIDLTGPSRCLYWGPYLHVLPGQWEAVAEIEVYDKSGPTELRVEVFTESLQHNYPATLPAIGRYEIRLVFDATDAVQSHELRLHLERGEIEGNLRFGGVQLRWIRPTLSASVFA